MDENLNYNKIRNMLNKSSYIDIGENLSDDLRPYTIDPESVNFHINELEDQESLFCNDSKDPDQLPLLKQQINARVGKIKSETFYVGRLLTKVKKIVGHGNFKRWIKDNLEISYSLANKLMNVYDACLENSEWVQTFNVSILYEIAAPGFPEDLRIFLFDYGDSDKINDPKEIRHIKKLWKAGKINRDSPEIKALLEYRGDKDDYEVYEKEINNVLNEVRQTRNTVCGTRKGSEWPTFQGREKPSLTKKQFERLTKDINDIKQAVDKICPDYIIEDVKPKIKLLEKN